MMSMTLEITTEQIESVDFCRFPKISVPGKVEVAVNDDSHTFEATTEIDVEDYWDEIVDEVASITFDLPVDKLFVAIAQEAFDRSPSEDPDLDELAAGLVARLKNAFEAVGGDSGTNVI